MNSSLFVTMKIVAQMIMMDKHVHPLEKSWFSALMNTFGATYKQRQILLLHLSGKSSENVEDMARQITDEQDRARLLNLLTVAIHKDKVVNPREKQFYQEVKSLLISPKDIATIDYQLLGKELQKRDRSIQLWNELGKFGQIMNARRGQYQWFYPYDSFDVGLLAAWILEMILGQKTKFFTALILIVVSVSIFYFR